MNAFNNSNRQSRYPDRVPPPQLRLHLHSPTLEAVIEALLREPEVSSAEDAVRVVDAMRPPMEIVTMGDLFGHVAWDDDEEEDEGDEDENEEEEEEQDWEMTDDGCEICGVRCSSTVHAPYPGLCVRCTAKVQHLQKMKGGKATR